MYIALRDLRKKKQVSVKTLVALLELKTEAAYYKKECGMTKFSLEEARRIADFFEMKIEDIFFENDVSKKDTFEMETNHG